MPRGLLTRPRLHRVQDELALAEGKANDLKDRVRDLEAKLAESEVCMLSSCVRRLARACCAKAGHNDASTRANNERVGQARRMPPSLPRPLHSSLLSPLTRTWI